MENIDIDQNTELPNGGGGFLTFVAKSFLPFTSILLSAVSMQDVSDMDIILTIILKFTSLATFAIYVLINWENIKVQYKKLRAKTPKTEKSDE